MWLTQVGKPMKHVLIVDADTSTSAPLRLLVSGEGLSVAVAGTLREARQQLALQPPNIVFLDTQLPDGSGIALFEEPHLMATAMVVLIADPARQASPSQADRPGDVQCLVKPVDRFALQGVLMRLIKPAHTCVGAAASAASCAEAERFGRLWGGAQVMQRVYEQISRVADTGLTVFITGESGTGKELVAQTVHDLSRRCQQLFLALNCGAISPSLIESELFGHEKGSFTGADRQHFGFFERASGGTLFLDEITEMPPALQVKLLRVLETGRFMRVGSTQSQATDLRVIAATNRDLQQAVAAGKLREDLMYRLNVFPIELPPLRERMDDVPLLAKLFLAGIAAQEGKVKFLTESALARLGQWRWPGNVRELRNAVQRAYVMAAGDAVDDEWLPHGAPPSGPPVDGSPSIGESGALGAHCNGLATFPIGTSMVQIERAMILATLAHFQNHRERTAAALGISLKTLYNRLKAYAGAEYAGRSGLVARRTPRHLELLN